MYFRHLWSSVNQYPQSTLNRPSNESRSTLHWHRDQHSVSILIDTWSTLNRHLSQQLVESQLIFADTPSSVTQYIWVGLHSANNQLTVDQVSIKCQSGRQLSVDLVWTKYRLRCQPRCWCSVDWGSIKGIDQHSTADAFSTYDPTDH